MDVVVECSLVLQVVSQTRCQLSSSFMAIPIPGVPEIHSMEPPWPLTDASLSSPSIFVLVCLVSWQYLFIETNCLNFLPFQNMSYALQTFAVTLFGRLQSYLLRSFAKRQTRASLKELLLRHFIRKWDFFLIRYLSKFLIVMKYIYNVTLI